MAASVVMILLFVADVGSDEPTIARPEPTDRETTWSTYLAQEWQGEAEHILPDGSRVDVLTDSTAWEIEWCYKWEQAFGQAPFYAASTGRSAGICLLNRGNVDDEDYLRALATLHWYRSQGVDIRFRVVDVRGAR